MADLFCQIEPIGCLWPELLPLAAAHWEEINPGTGPANIDCAKYEAAEAASCYHIMTLRMGDLNESILAGYASFWVSRNPQQQSSLQATQDALYLAKPFRKGRIARRLLVASEKFLASLGVTTIYQSVRRNNFGPLLVSCGYEPIETTYEKRI